MKLNGIIMITVVGSVLSGCGWQKSKEESQKVQTVQTNNVNTEETRAISATEVSQNHGVGIRANNANTRIN